MSDCTCNNFPAGLGNVTFGASVGIGTPTPANGRLDVLSETDFPNTGVQLSLRDSRNMNENVGGMLGFWGKMNGGGAMTTFAAIAAHKDNGYGGQYGAGLAFYTRADQSGAWTPKAGAAMFIDSAGRLGIGTTTPSEKLEVNGNAKVAGSVISATPGGNGSLLRDVATDYLAISGGYTRRGANTSGGLIQLMGNARALNPGSIQYILGEGASSPRHIFYNNGPDATILEIASIDNSGNLRVKGNIGELDSGRVAVDAEGYCLYG